MSFFLCCPFLLEAVCCYLLHKQERNKATICYYFCSCNRREFTVHSMDTEELLLKKVELNNLGILEPELKTNLQFAISAMDTIPHMLKKNASLVVEGNQILLTIRVGTPTLRCVVFQGPEEGIKIHYKLQYNRALCKDDINMAFFQGHDCPHDTPCMDQARQLIYPSRNQLELNIVCKELRITFSDPYPIVAIVLPFKK